MRHVVAGIPGHMAAWKMDGLMAEERRKSVDILAGPLAASLRLLPIGAATLLLAGCLGAPTYGTDTPADVQLLDDVTGIIAVTPKERPRIDYKPRPELVKPAKGEVAVLPPPQQQVASAGNPQWPESPEQRRARLRAEATANQNDSMYDPDIINDVSGSRDSGPAVQRTRGADQVMGSSGNPAAQREDFKRRMAATNQGDATRRRYLSEPPLTYRAPSATAPTDELGEDEWKKERDRKRAARKKSGTFFGDLWPF